MEAPQINCTQCRHYYVTWDPARPRGCKLHGFKTEKTPSDVVFRSSGTQCHGFEPDPAAENRRAKLRTERDSAH